MCIFTLERIVNTFHKCESFFSTEERKKTRTHGDKDTKKGPEKGLGLYIIYYIYIYTKKIKIYYSR